VRSIHQIGGSRDGSSQCQKEGELAHANCSSLSSTGEGDFLKREGRVSIEGRRVLRNNDHLLVGKTLEITSRNFRCTFVIMFTCSSEAADRT
jgi:hypothetical protein